MGTRADFYVGIGENAEWLGSVGYDGYPDGIDKSIFRYKTEKTYRKNVRKFLESEDHGTVPENGWPWPWQDSHLTDYSYAFVDGKVMCSSFGREWFTIDPKADSFGDPDREDSPDERTATCTLCGHQMHPGTIFPDMTKVQSVTLGKRSGLLVISL